MRRIVFFALFCVPQLVIKIFTVVTGLHWESPFGSTLIAGMAIVAAATILAWASELAEEDVSQGLALACVALVAVLPEYSVDLYFAWQAGSDLTYASYAAANMTGANRLLIGVGWSAIGLIYWFRSKKKSFSVDTGQCPAVRTLMLATVLCFVLPLLGNINLIVGGLLVVLFWLYMRDAAKYHSEEKLAEPFVKTLIESIEAKKRRVLYIGLFLYAAIAILASAESFAEGLLSVGQRLGIEEFLLVQWLAPLASEAPELLVAFSFAWRFHPRAGMGLIISSTVNQWTLLVGMLPLAYTLSFLWHQTLSGLASPWAMPLDARQSEELFLTAAQGLFATVIFCNFNFSLVEASLLFGLFALQLLLPGTAIRLGFGVLYLVLAVIWIVKDPQTRKNLKAVLFGCRQ